MFNNNSNKNNYLNGFIYRMFYLKSKSHLSNNEATRLAVESGIFAKGDLESIFNAESLSEKEKLNQEKKQQAAAVSELEKGLTQINSSSAIDIADIKAIDSVKSKLLVGKALGKKISDLDLDKTKAEIAEKLAGGDDLSKLSSKEIIKNF